MNLTNLYYKVCCVMKWNIGLAKGSIEDIIREKKYNLNFKWLPTDSMDKSAADPFILRTKDGNIHLLYEDFSMVDKSKYGKIKLSTLDNDLNPIFVKEILDTKSHISYPFVFVDNNKTYVIPESRKNGNVTCYEYDFEKKCLFNPTIIIRNLALLDSTIFKHNGKYWLFATLGDALFDHSKLYIYWADNLFGPYKAHKKNPVKHNLNGSRPAGNLIKVDGAIYRPAQNCAEYYGKSITINKVSKLTEEEFAEEFYLEITAEKNIPFDSGLHTINIIDDVIVVDGIRMIFMPFTKWKNFIRNKIKEYREDFWDITAAVKKRA